MSVKIPVFTTIIIFVVSNEPLLSSGEREISNDNPISTNNTRHCHFDGAAREISYYSITPHLQKKG